MTRPTGKIGPSKRYTTLMPPHDNCYNQLNTAPVRSNPAGTTTIYHFKYDVTMKTSYWEKANHRDCNATDHHHHRGRPARGNRRRRKGSRLPEPVRNHSRSGPRGLAARSAGRHAVGAMRGGAGVCLRSRRARSVQAPGAEFPWPPRSVAGDAARSSRRRQLHGGDGAERTRRRRPAFRRSHHRRTRRTLRSRGNDPDRNRQEDPPRTQARSSARLKCGFRLDGRLNVFLSAEPINGGIGCLSWPTVHNILRRTWGTCTVTTGERSESMLPSDLWCNWPRLEK